MCVVEMLEMSKHSMTSRQVREPERVAQRLEVGDGINRRGQRVPGEPPRRRGGPAQVVDHVAQLGGLLEIHLDRLGLHLVLQRRDRLARAAFEEVARGRHPGAVIIEGNLAHARGRALFDDRREAVLEVILARLERPAGAQAELVAHQVQRRAQRSGVRERTEIPRAVVLAQPRELEARDRVGHVDLDEQEALVVAQRDVVARPVFLDEAAFEQQRLGFALDGVRLKIPDALDQRRGSSCPPSAGARA